LRTLISAGDFVDINVVPKVKYAFQAVAREEKGAIGGVDWNKSPQAVYQTSTTGGQEYTGGERTPFARFDNEKSELKGVRVTESDAFDYDTTVGPKVRGWGMKLEIFILSCVGLLVLLLITVGVIYRFGCAGGKKLDEDEESAADSDDDGDDSADEDIEKGPLKPATSLGIESAPSVEVMESVGGGSDEREGLSPDKNRA